MNLRIAYKVWLPALWFMALMSSTSSFSQSKKKSGGAWIQIGTAAGFYSVNIKHAQQPSQKLNFLVGIRYAAGLDNSGQSFFLTGLDYFVHGLGFRSYYFKPDSIPLYNKVFNYDYSVYIHELQLPLEYKFLFRRRDNRLFSTFVKAGYHLRGLITSEVRITENGGKVKYDSPRVFFRTPLFSPYLNALASVSAGLQKNNLGSGKGNLFAELSYRYGFSHYYFSRSYAPSSLFMSGSHVFVLLGFRF